MTKAQAAAAKAKAAGPITGDQRNLLLAAKKAFLAGHGSFDSRYMSSQQGPPLFQLIRGGLMTKTGNKVAITTAGMHALRPTPQATKPPKKNTTWS